MLSSQGLSVHLTGMIQEIYINEAMLLFESKENYCNDGNMCYSNFLFFFYINFIVNDISLVITVMIQSSTALY